MALVGMCVSPQPVRKECCSATRWSRAGCSKLFEDKASGAKSDQNPDGFPDDMVARLAPIAHAHINMRGVISFHLDRAAKRRSFQ